MPVRRSTDPICLQHVWDAIRSTHHQRQVADYTRIIRYLQRVSECTLQQAELYLNQSIEDGFVIAKQKTVNKGPKLGSQVESYKVASNLDRPMMDGKDWYCIECHLAGDVTSCQLCHRVFHNECAIRAKQKPNIFKSIDIIANDEIQQTTNETNDSIETDVKNEIENNGDEKNERLTTENDNNNKSENNDTDESVNKIVLDEIYNDKLCSLCNMSKYDTNLGLEKEELNHLLSFILERIRSWLPDIITRTMAPEPRNEWLTDAESNWRANQLFYIHMDMSKMDDKLKNLQYTTVYDFEKDVLTVQHNVAIFHGTESQEYAASELMLNDCVHDIKELINCVDCYKHSNEKINNNWFCLPCRKPHNLVWAKQKGYPYWPAKVIKETESAFDVRFFGGKYERSVLPKNCIKPITVSQDTLYIKRSSAFNKAYEQLTLHQKLLENPAEVVKVTSIKEKRKTPLKPKKNSNVIKAPKRKSLEEDEHDIYAFHDSPSEVNDNVKQPKKRHTSLPNKSDNVTKAMKFKKRSSTKSLDISKNSTMTTMSDDEYMSMNNFPFNYDGNEPVTSSTEECFSAKDSTDTMQILEQPYSDAVEKMRRKLELTKDKNELIKIAMDCMQMEMDRQMTEHNDYVKRLTESHNKKLSETKKKQWCYYCEQDAIYHCCWNTAYCSQVCQQQHWQAEHKKVCRRKR